MTLDEAIARTKERARTLRECTKPFGYNPVLGATKKYIEHCLERAEYNEQLVSWLTELQERREADDISYEGMTVSEALHDLEDCVLPVVGGKSVRIAIKVLKAICERSKPCESEGE